MAYASASDVAALTHNLLGSFNNFATSTSPTLAQVDSWLSTGCAVIESELATKGYGAIGTTSAAYGLAQQANALFAAAFAEDTRVNTRLGADERTRGDVFMKRFDALIARLTKMDLSRMGVSQTSQAYAGGISQSDKDTVVADTDRVSPRFFRGMTRNREAMYPTDNNSAS